MTKELVNLTKPEEVARFAADLKKFIVTQKLFTPIQGKNYVNVEGWQYAGAATGILPVVKLLENLSEGEEIKYQATVELVQISTGTVVGGGWAICSNKEAKRKGADEYVIASMAQTRAVGKAYRNLFAWLMKAAGYEGTPAEDMAVDVSSSGNADPELYDKIQNAKSPSELRLVISGAKADDLRTMADTIKAKNKELTSGTKV